MKTNEAVETSRLNHLLGRELGRRTDGKAIFKWKWSEDLFWPAFQTGRKILCAKHVEVPIIGGGTETVIQEDAVPEYRRDRQCLQRNTWYMTKWLNPEELIWGWVGKHGKPEPYNRPSDSKLFEMWNERFAGAEFPFHGWRIPTDAWLPRAEGGCRVPNEPDTLDFIAIVKEQTRLNFEERLQDMYASEDRIESAKDKRIQDGIRDCFPAFLNPAIGKRGGFVSFPWTNRDRL